MDSETAQVRQAPPPANVVSIAAGRVGFTPDERDRKLIELRAFFPLKEVLWRITATKREGNRKTGGCLAAYADPRSYSDRLSAVFGVDGWTEEYIPTFLPQVPRKGENNHVIMTGKVMVTCRVTIHGLGSHTGTGEAWADDDNALTRTDAQAFKRACYKFGLGRYFYDVPSQWIDYDRDGKKLVKQPAMPAAFLPPSERPRTQGGQPNTRQGTTDNSRSTPQSGPHGSNGTQPRSNGHNGPDGPSNGPGGPGGGRPQPQQAARTNAMARTGAPAARTAQPPSSQPQGAPPRPQASADTTRAFVIGNDPKKRAQIMAYASVLGNPLFNDIIDGVTEAVRKGTNQHELGEGILAFMDRANNGLHMARSLAAQLPNEDQFYTILDRHQVQRLDTVPSFAVLTAVVKDLQDAVDVSQAA